MARRVVFVHFSLLFVLNTDVPAGGLALLEELAIQEAIFVLQRFIDVAELLSEVVAGHFFAFDAPAKSERREHVFVPLLTVVQRFLQLLNLPDLLVSHVGHRFPQTLLWLT